MSIALDHAAAKTILFEEATAARRGDNPPLVEAWEDRVRRLGDFCPHGKSATMIAALGTALLAKAADPRVDVFALLDRGEAPDSYSARSLADNVWARNRAELGVDLGANGANPLNNTPFIGKTRIDEITGVRNKAGWVFFMTCMEAAKGLASSAEAREALRGFIMARSRSLLPPIAIVRHEGDDLTPSQLIHAIDDYVAADSEGGRRAQAAVAAMLDAAFGSERVLVGVINDPDRHAPLDVSVADESGGYVIAFEVKDKPVFDSYVRSTMEKTVANHALRNLAFVAVSKKRQTANFDELVQWAAVRGIKITIFINWKDLYQACKCFAPATDEVFEGNVFRRILTRASQLGVSRVGLESFRAIGTKPT